MTPVGAHTMANALLVGHRGSRSNILGPQSVPSIGTIVPVMTLKGWQNNLQRSRPVDM